MFSYIYDGSFEGLLSCIFEIYKSKKLPAEISAAHYQQSQLLQETITIATCDALATRVLTRLDALTNDQASPLVYKMFLSELPAVEMTIYHFIDVIVKSKNPTILENFANHYVLHASKIQKMIHREVHRMHAFVRFQKNNDGIFYAAIDPDFNVLPLIGDHFERRYADQRWIIVDTKREYGLYYDLDETVFITLEHPVIQSMQNISEMDLSDNKRDDELEAKEKSYQALWATYFRSVNIVERKNLKLHLRHMPKRYWKYLIEKNYHKKGLGNEREKHQVIKSNLLYK